MIVLHVQERLSLERVPRNCMRTTRASQLPCYNPVRAALSQFYTFFSFFLTYLFICSNSYFRGINLRSDGDNVTVILG